PRARAWWSVVLRSQSSWSFSQFEVARSTPAGDRTTVFGDDHVGDDERHSRRNAHRIIECMAGLTGGIVRASTGTAHDSDPRLAAHRWRASLEGFADRSPSPGALIHPILGLRAVGIAFRCRKRRHHSHHLAVSRTKNRVPILEARALARVALLVLLG